MGGGTIGRRHIVDEASVDMTLEEAIWCNEHPWWRLRFSRGAAYEPLEVDLRTCPKNIHSRPHWQSGPEGYGVCKCHEEES